MSDMGKEEPMDYVDKNDGDASLVSVPQCTPIGLAFPPVSASSMFATGTLTIAGLSNGTCRVNMYSLRPDLIAVPTTVVVPRNVNSATVPMILSPAGMQGLPYGSLYARNASGTVGTTVVITPASTDAQSLLDANGLANSDITIQDVYFPDAVTGIPTDTGRITFSAPVPANGTVYLTSFSNYFQVPPSMPVTAGQPYIDVTANVYFQSEAFTTQVAAQFGLSSKTSNDIKVPAG